MASAAEPRIVVSTTEYYDSDLQSMDGVFLRARGALCPDRKRRTVHCARRIVQPMQVLKDVGQLIGFVYAGGRRVAGVVTVEPIDRASGALEKTVKFEPVGAGAELVGG